ncbi:MAG: hypothetical protein ISR83_08835 [Candidatus Marinimicrobia bacterium]|nr:hypothetical protein [Candidatus Neomarinimicrobiota bacterium]
MGLFSRKEKEPKFTHPMDMSPVEVVTHLFAIVQLADNESAYEERKVWANALSDMFPIHSSERADQFLNDAFTKLNQLSQFERESFLVQILNQIKIALPQDQISGPLKDHLRHLILADGMIMSGEIDALQMIEKHLGIKVDGLDEEELF